MMLKKYINFLISVTQFQYFWCYEIELTYDVEKLNPWNIEKYISLIR